MSLTQSLTDRCENVGSKIELIHNPEEEGQNKSETLNKSFFLKVGKPGKLFLQPNYSAFTKTSLGTIPSKIEKTLVRTEKSNSPTSTSFNTSLISIDYTKNSSLTTESIITYKNPKSYTTSFSSKGYGIGFVSKVNRFKDDNSKYAPGPGDYNPEKLYTLENEVKKSDLGKSLFLDKSNKSLQLIQLNHPQYFYTSQEKPKLKEGDLNNSKLEDKMNVDKKGNYFFESSTKRFAGGFFSLKNKNPGPGKYFLDTNYQIHNPKKLSPGFMDPQQKILNPIKYFDLNSNDGKMCGFKMHTNNKNGKLATFWNGVPSLGHTYDFGDAHSGEKKKLTERKIRNGTSYDKVIHMPDSQSNIELRQNKFLRTNPNYLPSISEEKNTNSELIISSLLKFKKKDLFGLAAPRWDQGIFHDNDTHFQVPGPAYYAPKPQTNKKSFNLNKKDFIFTNSIPYQTINGNVPTSNSLS